MKSFWQHEAIIWSEGIKQMDLVMKDGSGGSGHVHKRPDPEKFFPTKMRITLVQVSAGSTYDPSLVPKLPRKGVAESGEQKDGVASNGHPTAKGTDCCAGRGKPD